MLVIMLGCIICIGGAALASFTETAWVKFLGLVMTFGGALFLALLVGGIE